jgi:hypothetical protein
MGIFYPGISITKEVCFLNFLIERNSDPASNGAMGAATKLRCLYFRSNRGNKNGDGSQ